MKTWPMRIAADAAGMKQRALSQCFAIGALKLSGPDKKASGSGSRAALSRPRAYQAAVMQQLNKHGLSIPHAARLAAEFSDVGNVNRAPSECFAHGTTLLVVTPESVTVVNVFADTTFIDVCNSASVITVNCNEITRQVNAVLDNERSR